MDIAGVNDSWRKPELSKINQTVFKKLLAQKISTFFNFSLLALKLESLTKYPLHPFKSDFNCSRNNGNLFARVTVVSTIPLYF